MFVKNSYLVADADLVNMFNGYDNTQEEFISLKKDSTMEDAFKEKTLLVGQPWFLCISEFQAQPFGF